MVLINVAVVSLSRNSILLSWEILGVHNPDESFQSLFDRRIKPKIAKEETRGMTLEKCFVGHQKNSTDMCIKRQIDWESDAAETCLLEEG